MLHESVVDEITEIAENSAYLKAVEEKDVSLQMLHNLPPYEECVELEQKLKEKKLITFDKIFHEPCGYYCMKCFLIADYAVDKAIFIRDVEAYRKMRFESARAKVAKLLYLRFVAFDGECDYQYPKSSSVFQLLQQKDAQFELKPKGVKEKPSMLSIGHSNNAIGVYGASVRRVKELVQSKSYPKNLFDEVAQEVMNDLKLDVFPRFVKSDFYKTYIRTKTIEKKQVVVADFMTFRVLGRGGFGAVHACRKIDCGTLYAMKCVNKKLVKVKSALDNIIEERNVLTLMDSNFVTNLKYALQDAEDLYMIMDLMLGGDLKFHLINAGRFTEQRARFYAAQVLLGLEHVHLHGVIYRDMKLENVLLDHNGHCRISDLGLAAVTKVKIKGYAGTPGYTAPEMIRNKLYGPAADIFSYGVLLYRMLCGSKPFKGKIDRDLDKAVVEKRPHFPKEVFNREASDLLNLLLQKSPDNRLGCGARGSEEIKDHVFFDSIDWGLLEAGYIDPPFVPNKFDVNAASLKDIGDFDTSKYCRVKLDDAFQQRIANFAFTSIRGLHEEMVSVLEKNDEDVNFEKFAAPTTDDDARNEKNPSCCTLM